MLKFFRSIRYRLLDQGAVKRYLTYAIGEVFLVVLGILIALQINTWNENRKERALEQSTLIELEHSIRSDIDNFHAQIEQQMHLADVSQQLLEHLQAKKPYTPALDTMWEKVVRYYVYRFNDSAFEMLESRGIDLIKNEDLHNAIVYHYKFEQANLQRRSEIAMRLSDDILAFLFERVYPPITADFKESFDYNQEILIPIDYAAILADPQVVAKLSHSIKNRVRFAKIIEDYMQKQEVLSAAIEAEIARL